MTFSAERVLSSYKEACTYGDFVLEMVKARISERLESPARAWFITLWITEAVSIVTTIVIFHQS